MSYLFGVNYQRFRRPGVQNFRPFEDHSDLVLSVAFSPNGQLLASSSSDQTLKLWDPITGKLRNTLEGHSWWVWLDNNAGLSILNMQWVCIKSEKFLWLPPDYSSYFHRKNGILCARPCLWKAFVYFTY
jgi:WD40 repeat protein